MELHVVGCHGGETPHHRTCAFLLDDRLAIDAGSLTSGVELEGQTKIEACIVSHAHLDHVRDLATIADNRCQVGCGPLTVAGTRGTIAALRTHFFNNTLWPDFSEIPSKDRPTIQYQVLDPERPARICGYDVRPVLVHHTIESSGFVISGPGGSLAYSGDTGPTDRLWELLNELQDLRALLMEVSFPNREQALATASGHHTPCTLAADVSRYRAPKDLPILLYHIKPVFQREVERECAALKGLNLTVLRLRDQFVL